jgi:AcrR family transcriptional regulator
VPGRVISYQQAVDAGVRMLLATSCVDLDDLARELAVSRATLYRVVDGRDRLVADVLWSLTEAGFHRSARRARGQGLERLVDAAVLQLADVAASQPFRRFLRHHPATAFRALFLPDNQVHSRLAELWAQHLTDARERGELTLPFDAETTASLVVTVATALLYTGLLAGSDPDLQVARRALRSLLTGHRPPVVIDLDAVRPRSALDDVVTPVRSAGCVERVR